MLTGASPILTTLDVARTIQFYTEVLGFTSSWADSDPATFGAASWGKVRIMFSQDPERAGRTEGQEIWIDVDDVNALYAQHLERGAMILSPIEDKPWGFREYTVRDPNGYHLRFAGSPTHVSQGSGEFPPGVELVRRLPTAEEYTDVVGSGFFKEGILAQVLERAWAGVVALNPNGKVIGTVRIMYDSPGWFSIWDVAVLPAWQGQRIGTAMMEEAFKIVREESPGAFVYLFTTKHEFYERIGFEKESVEMIRV
ncbi:MAG TPA: GNAT family N-acetyltransferase [Fimbriimonadaceae bacterium]|jgi:ribosomal protein S18 acetylase RimI-like enzyme